MRIYSDEVVNFIKTNSHYSTRELSELINNRFNLTTTPNVIQNIKHRNGIKRGINRYSKELIDFVKTHAADYTDKELCEILKQEFNINIKWEVLKSMRMQYNITKGGGKYGSFPALTEKATRSGYITIKTESGKWVNKHKYLWEQAHGKIPAGHIVIFLDGNKRNFSLENLGIVSRQEHFPLISLGLWFDNPEFTKAGIAIVKHKQAIGKRLKKQVQ